MNDSTATIRDVWEHPDALERHARETAVPLVLEIAINPTWALLNGTGTGRSIGSLAGGRLVDLADSPRPVFHEIALPVAMSLAAGPGFHTTIMPLGRRRFAPDPSRLTTRIGDLA